MANILSIESSILLWAAIVDDLQKMQSFLQLDKINTQFYRRIIVRNFVSIIEAYLNISKEIIKLRIVSENSHTLKWEELAILSGQKAKLEFNGDVKLKDDFQSFVPHMEFVLKAFAKVFNATAPDFGDNGFKKLSDLVKRRNDITHPKSIAGYTVSNDEVKDIITAFAWFQQVHNPINDKFLEWLKAVSEK